MTKTYIEHCGLDMDARDDQQLMGKLNHIIASSPIANDLFFAPDIQDNENCVLEQKGTTNSFHIFHDDIETVVYETGSEFGAVVDKLLVVMAAHVIENPENYDDAEMIIQTTVI